MTATYADARDAIFARLNEVWGPTGFLMVWPDRPADRPAGRLPWARASLRHATGAQATLADAGGIHRWRRTGVLIVQIFTPSGEGLNRSYELVQTVTAAFQGYASPNGVWFRNPRISEVGPDCDWWQVNFLTDFEYDEVS